MSAQQEFMSQTFHVLAQPITALRATVELGLSRDMDPSAMRQGLKDCLRLLDRLMQDLAIFREIAGLDEAPPLRLCDGRALLESSVEEMAPVAETCSVELHLNATAGEMQCNEPMFRRAIFILLDAMIGGAARGSSISIGLSLREDGYRLELCPGTAPGHRQELCRKLMQFAGGIEIQFNSWGASCTFRK